MCNHRVGKISFHGHSKKSRQKQFSGYPRSAAVLTSCSFPVHMPPSALCPYKAPGQIGGGGGDVEAARRQAGRSVARGKERTRTRPWREAEEFPFPSQKSPRGARGVRRHETSLPSPDSPGDPNRTHACLFHTLTHESRPLPPFLPPLHHPCIPPSLPPPLGPPPRSCRSLECPSKYARVPGAGNSVGASEYRSAPCQLCQIRGRGGCGGARGNINMPPFTPHTLPLFPPPSLSRTHVRTAARLARPRSHMEEGRREGKEEGEEKRRKECGHDGAGRPRRE